MSEIAHPHIDFAAFDADNHYYEAEDAFTRHMDPKMARRAMQWGTVNGRKCLLVGGKVNRFIPNPTFDPVAKPGCLDEYFRGRNPEGKSIREVFGDLEPINPAYRNRDARLALMDTQGLEGMFMFPTLGVGMEESLKQDPEALCAAFGAFNRWMDEDWGFSYKDRIFAAPYITLVDVDHAVAELEWSLARDARVVVMRAGPIHTPAGGVSPSDARFDPFWSRVNEAGITVAYHSGDSGYYEFYESWGLGTEFQSFDFNPLRLCMSPSPILDTMAALVCGGLFDRHPACGWRRSRRGAPGFRRCSRSCRRPTARCPSPSSRIRSRPSASTSGCRPTTRTTCRRCATRSAPITCSSVPTSRTGKAWPSPPSS